MAKKRKSNSKPEATDSSGRLSVLIELRSQMGASGSFAISMASQLDIDGLSIDPNFEPVSMSPSAEGLAAGQGETYVVRGVVKSRDQLDELRQHPNVLQVWEDTPIDGFQSPESRPVELVENEGMAACPTGSCDCQPWVAKGTMADVASYLGVPQIWAKGFRGSGIVVGVVDSGITANGRPVIAGETSDRIPRVIGGWPSTWGTESSKWGNHGNMCATDVLGMAPEAQLYDLRVAGSGGSPGTISRALQAFNWAINRHKLDGTPHVLTNSWGIFQESWDATYARNPNHPFTRKVTEAIDEGIIVLFAAGNCGDTCPDGRCGPDNGPGKSIWGANGLERVMTVGAVNKNEQFIGYSSRGPAALSPQKPDFCSISHFQGYTSSDSGTSAATPILAGCVALIKQAKPSLDHDAVKNCLKQTAKQILGSGWNQHTGHGVVQVKKAFDQCMGPTITTLIRDRLTHPAIDRITLAIKDRITVPTKDRITLPVFDRRTSPLADIGTLPDRDIRPTNPLLDRPRTTPIADVGTNPAIDHRKSPHLDTLQEHLKPGIPRDRVRRPFILDTPHHAENWREYDDVSNELQGGDLYGVLAALQEEISSLREALYSLLGADADRSAYMPADREEPYVDDPDSEYVVVVDNDACCDEQ